MALAEVREISTDQEIAATFGVMKQLRSHLVEEKYLEMVRWMQKDGYRLAVLVEGEKVRSVAGFRISEYLHRSRHLYVDDLVTDESVRSKGYGKLLFDWLLEEARKNGCEQFHLDSGVQRYEAHKFYFRENLKITAYHFSMEL